MYKVERRSIPIPPREVKKAKRPIKYPFHIMDIGNSFFVLCSNKKNWLTGKTNKAKTINTVRSALSCLRAKDSSLRRKEFTIRPVNRGIRVWRTA